MGRRLSARLESAYVIVHRGVVHVNVHGASVAQRAQARVRAREACTNVADVPLSGGMPGISDHFTRRISTVTKRLAAELPVFEIPGYPGRVRFISVGQAARKTRDHEIG